MHAEGYTLTDLRAEQQENRARIKTLEHGYEKIENKLDALIRWMLAATVTFTGSLLLFVLRLLAEKLK